MVICQGCSFGHYRCALKEYRRTRAECGRFSKKSRKPRYKGHVTTWPTSSGGLVVVTHFPRRKPKTTFRK